MSERDSEIEFDFFEEPEPEPEPQRRTLRRGPRGPQPPEQQPLTPLLRLVALVVGAIIVVVLLVFAVDRCRGDSKEARYEDYMDAVAEVAADSQQVGRSFTELMQTPGVKRADVVQQLRGLATRQQQAVDQAQEIDPPGALRDENVSMIDSLQLRESGLSGLAVAVGPTAHPDTPREAAELLADQAYRFIASDVVWDDLFQEPAAQELASRDVTGVAVPDSQFLADPNLASIAQLRPIYRRIEAATEGPPADAVRGNGIISTTALPEGTVLSPDELTRVQASTQLAFRIAVQNSGDVQEVQVPVTLTIRKTPNPIRKRTVIDSINPGQTKTVTIRVPESVPITEQTAITVEVTPVENEANDDNNTEEYSVIFSL
jgi:hypothetical protein